MEKNNSNEMENDKTKTKMTFDVRVGQLTVLFYSRIHSTWGWSCGLKHFYH